jgi:hypothetical protein
VEFISFALYPVSRHNTGNVDKFPHALIELKADQVKDGVTEKANDALLVFIEDIGVSVPTGYNVGNMLLRNTINKKLPVTLRVLSHRSLRFFSYCLIA